MQPTSQGFLAAERLLAAPYASEVDLYEAMQRAAETLVPVDAFYVCLIGRDPEGLHFVHNREGDHFDTPESFPLGDGPTSRVARTGRSVVMVEPAHREGLSLMPFANAGTASGSAIHWPLWIEADSAAPPDGVLSVQAYAPSAYDEASLAAVEWLALRAADAMRRRNESRRTRESAESAALAAGRARAVDDVRRFVALLEEVAALREDPTRLLAEVRKRQVELTQWAPTAAPPSDPVAETLALVSDRELEVLAYVAQGMSTKEVAHALSLSEHTVKRHLDNVYKGGVLTRRAEVANAAPAIQATWMTRKNQ